MPLLLAEGDAAVAIPIVAIVFTFAWLIVKAIMRPFSERILNGRATPGGLSAEDQAVLARLHRTLTQMEARVDALETILVEQRRTKEKV